MFNNKEYPQTLCFKCARSCGTDRCSWATDYTPVPGWEAEQTFDRKTGEPYSYYVMSCPEFRKEGKRDWTELDDEGCLNLVYAFLRSCRNDYVLSETERRKIERSMKHPSIRCILMGIDPAWAIEEFRRAAEAYQLEMNIIRQNKWRIVGTNWNPKSEKNVTAIVIYQGEDGQRYAKLTERKYARKWGKKNNGEEGYIRKLQWIHPKDAPSGEEIYAWRAISGRAIAFPDLPEGVKWE